MFLLDYDYTMSFWGGPVHLGAHISYICRSIGCPQVRLEGGASKELVRPHGRGGYGRLKITDLEKKNLIHTRYYDNTVTSNLADGAKLNFTNSVF